jgi:uncharacterized DUF497 family protein
VSESGGSDYEFEWDDAKAESNLRKHGVAFPEAMSVLADPLARTRYDEDHSEQEERWVSLGRSAQHRLLVVVHTFTPTGPNTAMVRLISARPATPSERKQYEDE